MIIWVFSFIVSNHRRLKEVGRAKSRQNSQLCVLQKKNTSDHSRQCISDQNRTIQINTKWLCSRKKRWLWWGKKCKKVFLNDWNILAEFVSGVPSEKRSVIVPNAFAKSNTGTKYYLKNTFFRTFLVLDTGALW